MDESAIARLMAAITQKPDATTARKTPRGEYTVDGVPFTAPDGDPSLADDLATRALLYFAKKQGDTSTEAKWYRRAVIDRDKTPFTEADLAPREMGLLSKLARESTDGALGYKDQGTVYGTSHTAGSTLSRTLGRSSVSPSADGGLDVNDTYDFRPNKDDGVLSLLAYIVASKSPQERKTRVARWLAGRAIPEGSGRGVPVNIHIPRKSP